jgi:tetratricopeptide (TPR) repeat protein
MWGMNSFNKYPGRACVLLLLWVVSIDGCFAAGKAGQSEEDLVSLHQSMRTYMDQDNYQSALPLAVQVVDLVRRIRPSNYSEHAASMQNLALVQRRLGQFRASERNFKSSIKTYDKAHGSQSLSLIGPLQNLAVLYYEFGDYTKSLKTLRRVQHIMHRDDGVHTMAQLPVIEGISRIYVKTDRDKEADQQQKFYYTLNKINYGEKDPRMIPVLAKFGHWLKNSGQYQQALDVFQQNLDLITELDMGSELELVEPLREIASTMYLKGHCCPLEPLNRATDIVVRDVSIDIEDKIVALLELADMNLMKRQERVAKQLYRQAWDLMSSKSITDAEAHAFFNEPVLLGATNRYDVDEAYTKANRGDPNSMSSFARAEYVQVLLPAQTDSSQKELPRGEILIGAPLALCSNHVLDLTPKHKPSDLRGYSLSLQFSVDGNGKVFDVNVGGDNLPSNLREYVKNILYITRFRPRVVDGEAVTAEGVRIDEHFPTNKQQRKYTGSALDPDARTVYQGCLIDAVAQL